VESGVEITGIRMPEDILLTRLDEHVKAGVFTGRYNGPDRAKLEDSFEQNLARLFARADMPRLSGIQIKSPMYLDDSGVLHHAEGKPFTHILKPAGTSGYESLPAVEWVAMLLGRAAGFAVPATALTAMPQGMPPALIVERFDIRDSNDDKRRLAFEDMCSVLDLSPSAKYDGTIERVARAVRPLSTDPEDDKLTIFKRALFSWLIADGDMHLKNMALLKIAELGDHAFRSVRVAPLYDAVTTRVFPNLHHDRLALKLNGKDDNLRRSDFIILAGTIGLKAALAKETIDLMLHKIGSEIDLIGLPKEISDSPDRCDTIERMLEICRSRIKVMGA